MKIHKLLIGGGDPMSSQTTAHGIEQWPIVKLVPYARNPRKNDHAVERMAVSIREVLCAADVVVRW